MDYGLNILLETIVLNDADLMCFGSLDKVQL